MTKLEKLKKITELIHKEKLAIAAAKNFIAGGVGSQAQRLLVKIAQIVEEE